MNSKQNATNKRDGRDGYDEGRLVPHRLRILQSLEGSPEIGPGRVCPHFRCALGPLSRKRRRILRERLFETQARKREEEKRRRGKNTGLSKRECGTSRVYVCVTSEPRFPVPMSLITSCAFERLRSRPRRGETGLCMLHIRFRFGYSWAYTRVVASRARVSEWLIE